MIEIWKDIPNYEGYYLVSNLGRIKSLLFQNNVYDKKYPRERILKQKVSKDKCCRVELWKNGESKTWLVHRLVALTFLGIPKTKMTVNHKDGNRLNNKVENLEWLPLKENIQHAFRTGLQHQIKVKLEDKVTGTIIYPSSLAEGSVLMKFSRGYLSDKLKKHIFENDRYKWELL